jgi:hypothetical protein
MVGIAIFLLVYLLARFELFQNAAFIIYNFFLRDILG